MLLSKVVHPVNGFIRQRNRPRTETPNLFPGEIDASPMRQVARVLLELGGRMTYFKMTKLMYFIDLFCVQRFGHTIASNVYLRQVDGPWPPDLDKALTAMQGYEVRRFFNRRIPIVSLGPSPRFEIQLTNDVLDVISDVVKNYGAMSNSEIKNAVYHTDPMKFILREERKGKKMLNKPVLYKNKTAPQLCEY